MERRWTAGAVHRLIGWLGVAAFVTTGVVNHLRLAEVGALDAVRYTARANHVYILMSALANLLVARVVGAGSASARRRGARMVGSWVLGVAPAVLVAAYGVEGYHPRPERAVTSVGVIAVVAGTALVLWGTGRGRGE